MIATATIDERRGKPEVEVVIGQAQQGRYIIRLWDKQGRKPRVIGEGVNWDNAPDVWPITARGLDRRILSWDVVVSALKPGAGQLYSVTVTIRQDGKAVEGGVFEDKGKFDGTKAVLGMCMLSVSSKSDQIRPTGGMHGVSKEPVRTGRHLHAVHTNAGRSCQGPRRS